MKREEIFIEADELLEKLGDPNLRIYNATIHFFGSASGLTAREEHEQKHIPGAAFFDHEEFSDLSSPHEYMLASPDKIAKQLGQIGISNDSEVIIYAPGILPAATRVWWILHYAGHDNVRVLNGGLASWEKAGGTTESGSQSYPPTQFKANFRPELIASKDEVLAATENDNIRIEFALPLEMYDGVHIPNSKVYACLELMEEMSAFVPDDQFVSRLKNESHHERIITYCGGGIAATVNAVAHLIAGNQNVSVYDGSLIEWTEESMPIAKA